MAKPSAARVDLVNIVSAQTGESKAIVDRVAAALFDAIIGEVKSGAGRVTLQGFGSFTNKITQARVARNPNTGESVNVPAKATIRFKASKLLAKAD